MSAVHTPGPWEWDGPVWNYDPENEAPWLIPSNDDTKAVMTGTINCDEANARLIAAAPDLLEALQGVVKWADDNGRDFKFVASSESDSVMRILRAIEKATGATP